MMKWIFIGIIFLSGLSLQAQNFLSWQYNDRYFSAAFGTGQSMYIGELNQPNRIQEDFSHWTLGLEARLLSKVSARVEAGLYHVRGRDRLAPDSSFQRQRNLSFDTYNFEMSIQGVFYMRKYRGDYYRRWPVDPYLALGVGFTTINPTTTLQETKYNLREIATEDNSYGPVALMLPAAAGIKFSINEFVNFNLEVAYRYTFTDYLDDVSTTFPESFPNTTAELLSNRKDEIGVVNQDAYDRLVAGERRGDPDNNDQYLFLSMKLEIYLPRGSSPVIKKPEAN